MTEISILLVEDDKLQRKALHDTMRGWGHDVQACDCLMDARKLLSKGQFDLLLTDMRLPDGDGLEFIQELGSSAPGMSMVIMTAFADVRSAINAIEIGAYDYLPKPFENEQLQKIIRNVSDRVEMHRKITSLSRLASGAQGDVWQFDSMIGTDVMKGIFEKAQKVAGFSETTVLILGESGTGKGMLAKAIHRLSDRVDKPFVDINCSAIPAQLIESEIFGYERGAFTDAKNTKQGLLEVAHTGTVFLDEIGDMELNLQSKLLKVIEEKEFRRLGSGKTTSVDVRIIAATSRDLQVLVKEGKFRADLYYRLSVVPIILPPLRDHKASIGPISEYYLKTLSKEMGRNVKSFKASAIKAMMEYSWPGNVRELRNAVERSVILASGDEVDAEALGLAAYQPAAPGGGTTESVPAPAKEFVPMSLAEAEKSLIESVLKSVNGNKNKAAEVLKIHRTTLYKKIEEYGLEQTGL